MVENAWAHAGPQEPSAPEEGMAVAKLAPLTKHARSVASGVAEHTASALSKAGSQAGKQQEQKAHPALRAQEHPALRAQAHPALGGQWHAKTTPKWQQNIRRQIVFAAHGSAQ